MLAPSAEAQYGESELVQMGLESLGMWPDFAAQLERESGVDVDLRRQGTLIVAVDRDDLEWLRHAQLERERLGLAARMIDGDAARELEPHLAPTIPGAVWCPDDHQVDPRRLVQALRSAFEKQGGRLLEGVEVKGVQIEADLAAGVELATGVEALAPTATVIVAAGAWTRELTGLDDAPRVRPVRGQMLAVELGAPPLCEHVIRAPDAYLVPRSDGRLVIGATMEEMGFDPRHTAGGVMDLLVGAWEALPAIHDAPIVEMWTGFRPMTIDSEPVMRRSDSVANLVYATGHGRNGVLLTPLSARRIADLVRTA